MSHTEENQITGIHKVPLYGALSVAVLTLALVTGSVLLGKEAVGRDVAPAAFERNISFQTRAAGAFGVLDADTQELIATFKSGEGAFMRTSIRSMTRNRTSQNIKYDLPYTLVQSAAGELTLIDPQTGHSVQLNAFGQVATSSFSRLLPSDAAGMAATHTSATQAGA